MSLITHEWRLKLGAIALSLVLLGAVAFSQVQTNHVSADINYVNRPANLVVLTPPGQIDVAVSGPAELVSRLNKTSITVTADLAHIKKGTAQQVSFKVRSSDSRIAAVTPPPINMDVDDLKPVQLEVKIQNATGAPGWQVTKATAQCGDSALPCSIAFTGPASLTSGLAADVTLTDPIAADTTDLLNQLVKFDQNGRTIDISKIETLPRIAIDHPTVTIHIEAKRGSQSRQILLIASPPTRLPPPGYRITRIVIDPLTVVITGLNDALIKAGDTIVLDAVDLGTSTSDATFKVNFTYPDGTTGLVKAAKITYSISPNPIITPTPGA